MANQKSRDLARQVRPLGSFRPLKPHPTGLEPKARERAMRTITDRAAALRVEVDSLLTEVEDFILYHHETWQLGVQGQRYVRVRDQLRAWRDAIGEIGEDRLTWE